MCLGQELKQFPFWKYFLVVSHEEFAVAVNPFPLSYHLLFHFVNCFGLDRSLFPEAKAELLLCFFFHEIFGLPVKLIF